MQGIVVGVDGSGHSQRALEWAVREAAIRKAPLTVMSVFPLIRGYYGTGWVTMPDDDELAARLLERVQEEMDKVLAETGEPHPETIRVKVEKGAIAEELIKASVDADMLVVGSRGAGGFARLMQGSVCAMVTHHAHCPVVIIPHAEREHEH